MNHLKYLKLKDHLGENVAECCAEILVDAERLDSTVAFNPKNLNYITYIFDNTSDTIFHIWKIII